MTEQDEQIPLMPVVEWTALLIQEYGIGILTLKYLASPMESVEQAHSSPTYAFQPGELRKLGQKMLALADHLESVPSTSAGHQKH